MVWLNVGIINTEVAHPHSQALAYLFVMGVASSPASTTRGVIEDRSVASLFRYPQQSLLNQMWVKRHDPRLPALGRTGLRRDPHRPDALHLNDVPASHLRNLADARRCKRTSMVSTVEPKRAHG